MLFIFLIHIFSSAIAIDKVAFPKEHKLSSYKAISKNFMITSQGRYTTLAGMEMIKKGHN